MKGILTEKLNVGYGKNVVLKDVSIEVKAGKVVTLIGPNGCGKSTVLKSITGQLKTLGGLIYIDGSQMDQLSQKDIAQSMSMVMTERIKPELMSCREVVATGRYPYTGTFGVLSREDWKKVDEAIAIMDATEVANQDFSKISDGQRQRIMLARAMCQEPGILILDEPTSFLDMRYKLDILTGIRRMARENNMAVFMSLHELDLAMKVSDVIACVEGEQITKIGSPEEVFAGDYIQKLYHIDEECFDCVTGEIHLKGQKGEPEVFVIGGGGSALPVFGRLQRQNVPFATGIISEGDVEYSSAKATASEVVALPAFYPVNEEKMSQAKRIIEKCDRVICTLNEFGPLNEYNRELVVYAKSLSKEIEQF